jgi:hypothetical protein
MSATTVQNNARTFVAGEALSPYLLVKVESDGDVVKCGAAADQPVVGLTTAPAANTEATSISLVNGGGTAFATANEAIAAGDLVFTAAGGKVTSSVALHTKVGVAITASSADDDIIEISFFQ